MTHDDDEQVSRLREIKGPHQHLSPKQRQILAALAAGFAVYLASGPELRRENDVFIGNGTRLSRRTLEILLGRELIEEAGEQGREIFYKLTERGWNEVIRQHLHFAPDEIEMPLPLLVKDILLIIENYKNQYGYMPRVEVRGTIAYKILNWQMVIAYDETHNLLALRGTSDDDLFWISPLFSSVYSGSPARHGKLRLKPEPGSKEGK